MRAEDLGARVREAIEASGKPRSQIIAETGIPKSELSRIENGHAANVGRKRLALLAKVLGTTAGFLLGDPMVLSPGDRAELLRHRNWIDDKLPKIDARDEPNAILIVSGATRVSSRQRGDMVADTPQASKIDVPSTFRRRDVQHLLSIDHVPADSGDVARCGRDDCGTGG